MLTFEPETHSYALDGTPVPSVTRVLADIGLSGSPWWKEQHATEGSRIHAVCKSLADLWIEGAEWDGTCEDPNLVGYGKALEAFKSKFRLDFIAAEYRVYHPVYMYAGTVDLIAEDQQGIKYVIDFKRTVDQICTPIQLAAYGMCQPLPIHSKKLGVRLESNGGYDVHDFSHARHQQEWVSCLNVWRLLERKGKVKL